jgi:hypothetical protein
MFFTPKSGRQIAFLPAVAVLCFSAACADSPSPVDPLPVDVAEFRHLDDLRLQADTTITIPPVFSISGETVSITDLGATPNDNTDDTDAIQRAVLRGGNIRIPAGRFQISRSIQIPSGTRIFGSGSSSIIVQSNPAADAFIVAGTPQAPVENVAIERIAIESAPSSKFALFAAGAHNVAFVGNVVRGLGMVHTDVPYPIRTLDGTPDPTATAGLTRESQLTSDIWVLDNTGDGLSAAEARKSFGILIAYSRGAYVARNTVRNYIAGIQWWGGDADPARGGSLKLNNPRWARDLWIADNTVRGVDVSAIWGSMGERIAVARNDVQDCLDVCLDAEGSNDVLFARNRARNARNGVLSVFFHSRNVRFVLNEAEQDGSLGRTLFVSSNHDQQAGQTSIILAYNTLTYTAPQGLGDIAKAASRNFLMDSNTLMNVSIATETNNSGTVSILNNTLAFTRPIPTAAIAVGSNYGATSNDSAVIAGNRIRSDIAQANAPALLARQSSSGRGIHTVMQANEIQNFRRTVVAQSSGAVHRFTVTDNQHDGTIEISGSPRPTTSIAGNTVR